MSTIGFLDTQLFFLINHLPHVWWSDYLAEACSGFGYAWMIWFVIGIVLFFRKERNDHWFWVPLGITALLCFGVSEVFLKYMVLRPRPDILDAAIVVGSVPDSFSFPSTHATVACAFAYLFSRKALHWGWLYTLAFLVCFSRIYLGHHYPIDVVGGILVGSGIGWVSVGFNRILHRWYHRIFDSSSKKRRKKL